MKSLLLSFCTLFISYFSIAQCADIGMYSLVSNKDTTNKIIYYNPVTESFDTLMSLKGLLSIYPTGAAIDAYNGRIFYTEFINAHYRIVIVDINNRTVTRLSDTISMIGDMEYDMFENKLVIRNHKEDMLLFYDLAQDSFYQICKLPANGNVASIKQSCYNSIEQVYSYCVKGISKDTSHIYTVDINSKQVINVIDFSSNTSSFLPFLQTYDLNQNRIIGTRFDSSIIRKVVSFDNMTGTTQKIVDMQDSFYHHNSLQYAVFDAWSNSYYFPNFAPGNILKIKIININTGKLTKTIDGVRDAKYNVFHGAYNPTVKSRPDSSLIVTFGKYYQWYFNGVAVEGAKTQIYKPLKSGHYSAEVTFICGRKAISNEIYLDIPEVVNNDLPVDEVEVRNNIIGEEGGQVVFPNPDKTEHTLLIYNGLGQLVQSYYKVSANFVNIQRGSLASGIYYFRLFKAHKTVSHGKLLVP